MLVHSLILFSLLEYEFLSVYAEKYYFDSFYANPLTKEELFLRDLTGTTDSCVTEFKPCDPKEGRRLDGSCNNLYKPSGGASNTPFLRLLPAVFSNGTEPRLAKNSNTLPMARRIRTTLLAEGKVPDLKFTQLLSYFLVFSSEDSIVIQDTINYVLVKTYCCEPQGALDNECVPNEIPANDPVHQFSGNRCLNMTRPISYQSSGCMNQITPERINPGTPPFDLSQLYGSELAASLRFRSYTGGLLKFEVENGKIWPPSFKTPMNYCLLNQLPSETRCHDTPELGSNTLLGVNIMTILFHREHNRIAKKLAELNSCWDDEKLFYVARDTNIATYSQILYYELYATLMGSDNLITDGVLSSSSSFRDLYSDLNIPQISMEYPTALRWLHIAQEATVKLYNPNGTVVKETNIVDLTLRTGFIATGNNLDYIIQGSFRQPGGNVLDAIVDPSMSENVLGPFQRVSDVTTNDLSKNRYIGHAPYVKYLELCRGQSYRTFEDLLDVIKPEHVELLKEAYNDIVDIDLLAGVWLEKSIKGGYVPPTFYCIVADQLLRNVQGDRHWYERPNRPNAFTEAQLLEIRKASMARVLCDNGDSVTEIQPKAFEIIGFKNEIHDCSKINKIDFNAWKDFRCDNDPNQVW